jgi:hypothetical protein
MSEAKHFNLAILVMDVVRELSKRLSLILVALTAVAFYFAGTAFAEGNLVLGVIHAALGVGNIVLLIQLRRRISKSKKRLTSFPDVARNGLYVDAGAS